MKRKFLKQTIDKFEKIEERERTNLVSFMVFQSGKDVEVKSHMKMDELEHRSDCYLNRLLSSKRKRFEYSCGIEKCAIVPKRGNKAPVIKFQYSKDSNGCEKEYNLFKELQNQGLDNMVAKYFTPIKTNKRIYYLQEKATPYFKKLVTSSQIKSRSFLDDEVISYVLGVIHRTGRAYKIIDTFVPARNWIKDCIIHHGAEKTIRLFEFLADNSCNDFHTGNVGYIGDKPVILDYSGYTSQSEEDEYDI